MRNSPTKVKSAAGAKQGRRQADRRLPAKRVSGVSSLGPVVELGEIERRHPRLAAPREDVGLRREPLVEAIERAFLRVHAARTVLQVVCDHTGTAVGTEDALEPLVSSPLTNTALARPRLE